MGVEIDGAAAGGDGEVRGDTGEWLQNEESFVQARMRDGESGFVEQKLTVNKQIKIERSRSPAGFAGAIAAAGEFEIMQQVQEIARQEGGGEDGRGVEIGAAGVGSKAADRGGLDDGAQPEPADTRVSGEFLGGEGDVGRAIAKIGAKRDGGASGSWKGGRGH